MAATVTNTGECKGQRGCSGLCEGSAGETWKSGEKADWICKDAGAGTWVSKKRFVIVIPKYDMASYDDSGVTGHKSCYVLEEGML